MISVIIPTYNRKETIIRSVRSVLDQTVEDLEVIVVDDYSTDSTEGKLKEIEDKRLRYVRLGQNSGANFARNKGIELAKGELIAFQDSDDYWHKNKLEEQIAFMNVQKADIVFCTMKSFDGNEETRLVPEFLEEGEVTVDHLLYGNLISTQVILGKKDCFLKENFDNDFPRYQDWDLVLRLSQNYKVSYQKKILVDRYTQHDSISKQPLKALESFEMILQKYNHLYQHYPDALASIRSRQAVQAVLGKKDPNPYLVHLLKVKRNLYSLSKWGLNKIKIYPLIIKYKY